MSLTELSLQVIIAALMLGIVLLTSATMVMVAAQYMLKSSVAEGDALLVIRARG